MTEKSDSERLAIIETHVEYTRRAIDAWPAKCERSRGALTQKIEQLTNVATVNTVWRMRLMYGVGGVGTLACVVTALHRAGVLTW